MKRSKRATLGMSIVASLVLVIAAASCTPQVSHGGFPITVPGNGSQSSGSATASAIPMVCPRRADGGPFSSPGAGSPATLVPGAPIFGTACWYPVLGSKHGPTSSMIFGHQLHRLVTLLNGLRRPFMPGIRFCTVDRGNAVVISFQYADATTQVVHVELSGCAVAANGKTKYWLGTTLRKYLAQLTPKD